MRQALNVAALGGAALLLFGAAPDPAVAGTPGDLCSAIDPAALGKSLGIAGVAQAQPDGATGCQVSFDQDGAELDVEIVPRTHFGMPKPGPRVKAVPGLGERAVFDETTGSDGIPTQSLFVLGRNTGLTIQLMRHHLDGPQWHVALARRLLAKLEPKA